MSLMEPDRLCYVNLIEMARAEDLGTGDVTSEITIPAEQRGKAAIVFREAGVLCGMNVVRETLRRYDAQLQFEAMRKDGERLEAGEIAGRIGGPLRGILAAERVLLNFLQRLGGIATITAAYVEQARGTRAKICDTRKTTPGWRELEKYAVRCGGGVNHRKGLYDAVLIKDNHLAALGAGNFREGLAAALARIRERTVKPEFVEVEADTLEQFEVALELGGIDMILLDNMTCEQMREAVKRRDRSARGRGILLEASGGVTLESVKTIALTGVDRISAGALTHSARSLDIGLDLE